MPALNCFLKQSELLLLRQAAENRTVCRSYSAPPSTAHWAELSYWAGRYAFPGVSVHLLHIPETMFTGTLFGSGRISGCTAAAILTVDPDIPESRIFAGICGETLVLEATAAGLGTCWLTDGFKANLLPASIDKHKIAALILLGMPKEVQREDDKKRKSMEKLCHGNYASWPTEIIRAAESIRMAPSAGNNQPWQIQYVQDTLVIETAAKYQLDLGIAITHAELYLTFPHTWQFTHKLHTAEATAQLSKPVPHAQDGKVING